MKISQTHPTFKKIVAVGCIVGALVFFFFQGYTSGIAIGKKTISFFIGFSLNFLESGLIAFIAAPMAGKVSDILARYGFKQSKNSIIQLEKIIDTIGLFFLLSVYGFDLFTTFQGAKVLGINVPIALWISLIQLIIFETMFNIGLWLLEDAKIQKKAMDIAFTPQQETE